MTDKTASSKPAASAKDVQPLAPGARVALDQETAHEVGFFGLEVDPTPDENYSLLTPPDAPTPETDPEAFAAAQSAAGIGPENKFTAKSRKGGRS